MRFTAHFIHKTEPPYYVTVDADTLNDADKLARRKQRKGYILHTLTERLSYE